MIAGTGGGKPPPSLAGAERIARTLDPKAKRDTDEYFAEFTPTNATPTRPCDWCGDSVFYQLSGTPWLCRSCDPPGPAGWRTVACHHDPQCEPPEHVRSAIQRWFVVLERRS